MNKIVTYAGRPIEDLSTDELIEALNSAFNTIQELLEEKNHERDVFEREE